MKLTAEQKALIKEELNRRARQTVQFDSAGRRTTRTSADDEHTRKKQDDYRRYHKKSQDKILAERGLVRWGETQYRCEECEYISSKFASAWMQHKEGCDHYTERPETFSD